MRKYYVIVGKKVKIINGKRRKKAVNKKKIKRRGKKLSDLQRISLECKRNADHPIG